MKLKLATTLAIVAAATLGGLASAAASGASPAQWNTVDLNTGRVDGRAILAARPLELPRRLASPTFALGGARTTRSAGEAGRTSRSRCSSARAATSSAPGR